MRESIVDPEALNLATGPFGTCFNGQTFQVEALTSFAGWQYATYVSAAGHVGAARRRLADGAAWQRFAFTDYVIDHDDVHNVPVIGICPADGTIHLAFDHHNSPLHYRVSQPGVATEPELVEWSAALFGEITSELVDDVRLDGLTYPSFVPTPDGSLRMYYRLGMSGDGDTHLADYRPGEGGWRLLGHFVSRRGRFGDSDSRCAYHNGYDYDAAGRLHTTWVWREDLRLHSNHDLQYAYSEDDGLTWRNNAGDSIAVTGDDPVHLGSRGVTVRPIPYGWGLMNQVTQTVDAHGRVHVMLWQQPPDASAASADLSTWRYLHHWRDEQGRWHQRQLPYVGRKPSVVAGRDDTLVLVFTKPAAPEYHGADPGGPLYVLTASAAEDWTTWREVYRSSVAFVGEPRIDKQRWQDSAELSLYAQRAPDSPGEPSPLCVLDIEL